MVIIPCFVFHKNIEKIHTIMNQYFDAGRLSFEDGSEMNPPKYNFHIMTSKKIPDEVHAEEYYICAVERQYVVLLPFMTE